jgi:hypothetical protein
MFGLFPLTRQRFQPVNTFLPTMVSQSSNPNGRIELGLLLGLVDKVGIWLDRP